MRTFFKFLISSLLLVGVALSANEGVPSSKMNVENISEKSVEKFVAAAVQINVLKQSVQQKLQEKNKNEQPTQAQIEKANQEFILQAQEIIKSVGLSLKEYTQYAQLMQEDKQFSQRVNQAAQKMQN
jgi:hypothetical protein